MAKKEKKPKVLWSVNLKRIESDGPADYPLYEIHQEGKRFIVNYHGCCPIHSEDSLEAAKQFVRNELAK